jgi:hypothetical protein
MNYEYTLGQCANYFLDILDVPKGDLPDRAKGRWDDVFSLASDQRIYHYLAAWALEFWDDALPGKLKDQLSIALAWNKARNIKLSQEIIELAKMLREEEIQALFLKGAAGLVRGLYPLEWRYISDIDVLVKKEKIEKVKKLIKSCEYVIMGTKKNQHPHHMAPFKRMKNIAWVEIHTKPYINSFNNSLLNNIFNDSENIMFGNELISVPSITDQVWILLRTDLIRKVFVPRLNDAIELTLINERGFSIDYGLLTERAEVERIPNIIPKMLHTVKCFFDISSPVMNDYSYLEEWNIEGINYQKKFNRILFYRKLRLYCASLKYFASYGFRNKIRLLILFLNSEPKKNILTFLYPQVGIVVSLKKIKKYFLHLMGVYGFFYISLQ